MEPNCKDPRILQHNVGLEAFQFSQFRQIFQMAQLKSFHHRSTNVCKNTVKGKTFSRMKSFCAKIHQSVVDFCVNQRAAESSVQTFGHKDGVSVEKE